MYTPTRQKESKDPSSNVCGGCSNIFVDGLSPGWVAVAFSERQLFPSRVLMPLFVSLIPLTEKTIGKTDTTSYRGLNWVGYLNHGRQAADGALRGHFCRVTFALVREAARHIS